MIGRENSLFGQASDGREEKEHLEKIFDAREQKNQNDIADDHVEYNVDIADQISILLEDVLDLVKVHQVERGKIVDQIANVFVQARYSMVQSLCG